LPLLLLGATCVTRVEQQGPTGPWIGEVTNFGPGVLQHASIIGTILDAEGKTVGPLMALNTCPAVILPGQKGYFVSLPAPSTNGTGFVQPYQLSPLTVRPYAPAFRPGKPSSLKLATIRPAPMSPSMYAPSTSPPLEKYAGYRCKCRSAP